METPCPVGVGRIGNVDWTQSGMTLEFITKADLPSGKMRRSRPGKKVRKWIVDRDSSRFGNGCSRDDDGGSERK